jgi:hypothetical protein
MSTSTNIGHCHVSRRPSASVTHVDTRERCYKCLSAYQAKLSVAFRRAESLNIINVRQLQHSAQVATKLHFMLCVKLSAAMTF